VIRLRLSRRLLKTSLTLLAVIAGLCSLYFLGDTFTPRPDGRPILLSPSVWATENFRRSARGWLAEMAEVDERILQVLQASDTADAGELYRLSGEAESLTAAATDIVQDIAYTSPPPTMVALQEQAQVAASGYLEAAMATARWVGAPSAEARAAVLEIVQRARALRVALEQSQWLARP